MAPKKVEEPERKPLIGRVGTNLKVGIVGIPNVGKSTFFNVLTKSQAAAENFPFCTIDPNENNSGVQLQRTDLLLREVYVEQFRLQLFNLAREYHQTTIPHKSNHRRNLFTSNTREKMCDKSAEESERHVAEELPDDGSVVTQKDVRHATSSIIYPKANLYYAFTEDTHPLARIAVTKSLQRERLPVTELLQDPLSVVEATNRYLLSDPPSFVIFGKPGLNSIDLASAIAEAWRCVLISPSMLIQQEINSGSKEGCHMKETLENGERVAPDIVMNLIRHRIKKRNVRHRGYVVEGLPLIPDEPNLDRDRLGSHEDETCDRNASCNHQTDNTANSMKLPKESVCEMLLDYEREILQQINEMFTEWLIKPSIIIYMMCPKQDVVNLITHQDAETTVDVVEDTRSDKSDPSLNLRQNIKEQPIESNDQGSDYSEVSDVKRKVELQCDLYVRLALPVIDKWILAHDPQRVIRVDGRGSTQRILQIVDARLRLLPLQPSILPERLTIEMNEPSNDLKFDTWDLFEEEAKEILRQKEIVSAEFPWKVSMWNFYCPVELSLGRRKKGHIKYTVRFLRNIFFLSSERALDLFFENPRTFLSPPNPRPTCKIAVIGPQYSGKSELSQRLAEIFNATVFTWDDIKGSKQDSGRIPYEKLEDKLFRDDGYVLDGLPIDMFDPIITISKKNIFEDIIILFEEWPYNCLLTRFKKFHIHMKTTEKEYQNALHDYSKNLEAFTSYLNKYNLWNKYIMLNEDRIWKGEKIIRQYNLRDIKNITEYVVNCLKHPYEAKEILKETTSAEDNTNSTDEETKEGEEEYSPRVIDLETAERLLNCGYNFLSSFARRCPVQAYANEIPIVQDSIFPVAYHAYIYFLGSEEALSKFLEEPSKYLTWDFYPPALPLRIAIIGPPMCGKTTLADRFAKTYGLKRITRDIALRHMLKHYSWTESARMAEDQLQAGQPVSFKYVAHAIETLSLGPRAASQGYVLDDCPSNREEVELLILSGVQPMIVLDLKVDLSVLLNHQTENNDSTGVFSSYFLRRYENWQVQQASFRDWLKRFSRNVVELDATRNKWGVWNDADYAVCSRFADITLYHREADLDKVHNLRYMCVSPFEFRERQSHYESYCPVCLFREDVLQASSKPTDNQGMVQFKEHFYWICPRHMAAFVKNPQQHLPPVNTATLPDERPRIIEQVVEVGHVCWERRIRLEGWCPVTYVEGTADRKLTRGRTDLAVLLGEEEVYLLCSKECRDKFFAKPSKYRNVKITALHEIDLRYVPNTDFLERTVAKEVVEAVKRVAARRPKIVGLSPAVSAAIHIGIHLKTHNTSVNLDEAVVYEIANERMAGQDKIVTRRVPVPDARFDYLCEYFKPASKVPAFLHVMDIAGLVKGAAEGQGLGNSFLSHIGACDGIFHLCRAFEDDDVTHVEGDVNPVRDLDIISEELLLKDVEFLNTHLEKLEKLVIRGNDKKLKPEYDTLLKVKGVLVEDKKHIRFADWSANDIEVLNKYLFLTSKPIIYLVNLSEKDYIRKKNKWLIKIKEWVDKNDSGAVLIPFSGIVENKLLDMDEAERAKYFEEHKVTSALDKIIVQGYKALQLQYFFTAGHDEVKAWTIQKGTKAPQAAGKIHTDFEKGFIMGEVMKFDDFKNEGSEAAVKAAGKYRQQGRNYVVEDGDIIFFKFNAGAGLKDAKKK